MASNTFWSGFHYYVEMDASVSVGAQATVVPSEIGPVPVPYMKGTGLGVKINLGSTILYKFQIDSDHGVTPTNAIDKNATQGSWHSYSFYFS